MITLGNILLSPSLEPRSRSRDRVAVIAGGRRNGEQKMCMRGHLAFALEGSGIFTKQTVKAIWEVVGDVGRHRANYRVLELRVL